MSDIDNIVLSYENVIDSISLDFPQEITSILLDVGSGLQAVISVNSMSGAVQLTATAELSESTVVDGYYTYLFTHNLNYDYPIIYLYDEFQNSVISDISVNDSNSVIIKSLIDISGYRVVVQR